MRNGFLLRFDEALRFHPPQGDVDGAALEGAIRALDELQAVHRSFGGEELQDEPFLSG